jgi:hypothetical protein
LLPKFNKMKTAPNLTGTLARYQQIDLKDNFFNEELSAVGGSDDDDDDNMQLGVN